jgi:hypothetical protein
MRCFRLTTVAALLAALLCLIPSAPAQCPGGQCQIPQYRPAYQPVYQPIYQPAAPLAHGWYKSETCRACVALYWHGEKIGDLEPNSGVWKTAGKDHSVDLAETFGLAGGISATKPKECVCKGECDCKDCPRDCIAVQTLIRKAGPNFGMSWTGTGGTGERFTINGVEVKKLDALKAAADGAAAGAPSLPDDSALLRLTVIGTDAERTKVLRDVDSAPELAPYKGKVIPAGLSLDAWQAKDAESGSSPLGFKAGHPSIYLQSPAGKVLHRQDDYSDGPAGLANALRKADPLYDPSKDPDLRKAPVKPVSPDGVIRPDAAPKSPTAPPVSGAAVAAVCLLGAAGLGALRAVKK